MKSAELKNSLLLYAVTDRAWLGKNFCCETLCDAVLQAIEGGATLVQLREKELSEKEFLDEAFSIKEICTSKKIPLIINDNVKIAKETDAFGVHIGQSDMELKEARKILGAKKIIGVSCQTVEQALQAEKNGADYLGVGAVFSTSTKTDADNVPLSTLKDICQSVKIPVVAIGGISLQNMSQLKGSGIAGVSVISAIFAQQEIKSATKELKALAKKLID
ncbi:MULTISPECIES: thiamine phosphate synthase [unclassified Treponema]|uniref:thiamine phosphate synthase n=1 Tax=unclassified Treponema TaxID=2638727 RepID=UPI000E8F0E30|nr:MULTISPECIES: thiamine phosphate synthase [unclassified Treponema]HBP09040.1 thiamine phosphate synthase [Treponema sp.]